MYQMDDTDRELLRLLQDNSKLTTKEIAGRLNLTTTPVFERIKRLEREGYIRKYVALLDREKIGKRLLAFCNVSLKEHAQDYLVKFQSEIQQLDEVLECYHVAGMFDYLLKVVVDDMPAYEDFIVHKLAVLPNIGRVQSSFVMTEIKAGTAYDLKGAK